MTKTLLSIADFKNDVPITLKVLDLVVALDTESKSWPRWRGHKFTSNVIKVVNIYSYPTYNQLTYFSDGRICCANIPISFLVTKASITECEKIEEEYIKYSISNLSTILTGKKFIGSDPEVFIVNEKEEIIPAFDFLGSKSAPSTTSNVVPFGGNKLYWDGFQAEFETTPNDCLSYVVDSVHCGLRGALEEARKHNPNAKLSIKNVMDIPQSLLDSSKPEHVGFGCMPSLNAYGTSSERRDGRLVDFRPAGGHIHFGIGKHTEEKAIPIVKALDAIIGVACVALFAELDDPRRRTLYGLAGEYRLPSHGIEYRVLSNAWLCHPLIMNLVFDLSRKVVFLSQKGLFARVWKSDEKEVISCINNLDVNKAKDMLDRNKDMFIALCKASYSPYTFSESTSKYLEAIFNGFRNGVGTMVKDPANITDNWLLQNKWLAHNESPDKSFKNARLTLSEEKKVA
jgi:Phage phiEco32-like COOH.NH2 ligase-type 2